MKTERHQIHGKFESIMKLAQDLEKSPKRFGTDQNISHSEIHLIEIVGDNRNSSVTDISKILGYTKGAVSQTLKKLEAKGLTNKRKDPKNLSRAIVELTAKGKTAYWSHKDWHETMDGGFAEYMGTLTEKEVSLILGFMYKVEDFLKRRLKSEE